MSHIYIIPSAWNLVMTLGNPSVDDDVEALPNISLWDICWVSQAMENSKPFQVSNLSNPIRLEISI
jgi:hypothetical protein